ncbi:hypothetical protein Tco_0444141, partial [Tanacetum coccineum]
MTRGRLALSAAATCHNLSGLPPPEQPPVPSPEPPVNGGQKLVRP